MVSAKLCFTKIDKKCDMVGMSYKGLLFVYFRVCAPSSFPSGKHKSQILPYPSTLKLLIHTFQILKFVHVDTIKILKFDNILTIISQF